MASLQTHRDREDTDGTKYIGAIGGLDITVDGCPPEFDIVKLRWEIDQVRYSLASQTFVLSLGNSRQGINRLAREFGGGSTRLVRTAFAVTCIDLQCHTVI